LTIPEWFLLRAHEVIAKMSSLSTERLTTTKLALAPGQR
jgi:hypothetical protein